MPEKNKPKLLLHICCIGCGAYVSKLLSADFAVSLYFYNPSIYPATEYDKRLEEIERVAGSFEFPIIHGTYDHALWRARVKGLEDEPEKGKRCLVCYADRLESTAQKAKVLNFDHFASTLTVSPHKLAVAISQLGLELGQKYAVNFYDQDFKKQDGFKKAVQVSRELNLYRQDYCGCEFSMRS